MGGVLKRVVYSHVQSTRATQLVHAQRACVHEEGTQCVM